MKSISELEQIVEQKAGSSDAASSIYTTLEELERCNVSVPGAYQEILEAIVYDIFKMPKK